MNLPRKKFSNFEAVDVKGSRIKKVVISHVVPSVNRQILIGANNESFPLVVYVYVYTITEISKESGQSITSIWFYTSA